MLASAIIDLILAAIIIEGLPGTAAWVLGFPVRINLVFGATALVVMELHAREVDSRSAVPTRQAARLASVGACSRMVAFINPRLAQRRLSRPRSGPFGMRFVPCVESHIIKLSATETIQRG